MPKGRCLIKFFKRFRLPRRLGEHGFSPVEILLAATVFGFLTTALIGAIIYGRSSTAGAGDRVRATQLADEGIEAVRNLRDSAFANVTVGTFGLAQSGNQWTLSGSSDTNGIFTRQVTISSVDSLRKTITSTVTWPQGTGTSQVSTTSRLTNWTAAIIQPASWPGAVFAGSLDASGANDGLKVATVGNYAYLVRNDGTPDFLVINISNPAAPTLVGSLALTGAPTNIAVSGNYAYVTTTSTTAELQIINISSPAAPVVASNFDAPGTASGSGIFVSGNTAYLTRLGSTTLGVNEFLIINIANPTIPLLVGSYNNNINMREVWVSGNHAYIATESDTAELLVINVSIQILPVLVASLDLGGTANAVAIDGYSTNRLLIAQGTTLQSINITTPTSPAVLGTVVPTGGGIVNDVDVESTETYAFIGTASTAAEFQVINIANPAAMTVARVVDIAGTTSTLNGVAYNASLDVAVSASASGTQEVIIFKKN